MPLTLVLRRRRQEDLWIWSQIHCIVKSRTCRTNLTFPTRRDWSYQSRGQRVLGLCHTWDSLCPLCAALLDEFPADSILFYDSFVLTVPSPPINCIWDAVLLNPLAQHNPSTYATPPDPNFHTFFLSLSLVLSPRTEEWFVRSGHTTETY